MRWTACVPRWVKVFVITALGLPLLMVVAMLLSGGQHGRGPDRVNDPTATRAGKVAKWLAD
jgi:branched-subunit amino acid permease